MTANGGFPPIKICNLTKKETQITKERHAVSNIKNINIRKILNSNAKNPLIIMDDQKENDLIEV